MTAHRRVTQCALDLRDAIDGVRRTASHYSAPYREIVVRRLRQAQADIQAVIEQLEDQP